MTMSSEYSRRIKSVSNRGLPTYSRKRFNCTITKEDLSFIGFSSHNSQRFSNAVNRGKKADLNNGQETRADINEELQPINFAGNFPYPTDDQ